MRIVTMMDCGDNDDDDNDNDDDDDNDVNDYDICDDKTDVGEYALPQEVGVTG